VAPALRGRHRGRASRLQRSSGDRSSEDRAQLAELDGIGQRARLPPGRRAGCARHSRWVDVGVGRGLWLFPLDVTFKTVGLRYGWLKVAFMDAARGG